MEITRWIKDFIVVIILLILSILFNLGCDIIKADSLILYNNNIKYEYQYYNNDHNYIISNYEYTKNEYDNMISLYHKLIASNKDTSYKGEYKYFVGMEVLNHRAVWSKTDNNLVIRTRDNLSISDSLSWQVNQYWGVVFKDNSNNYYYCANANLSNPHGNHSYTKFNNEDVARALSYGFPQVKVSNNEAYDYGRTQLAIWEALGQRSYGTSHIGNEYYKVIDAYKNRISENKKNFKIERNNFSDSKIVDNFNVSNFTYFNGSANFKLSKGTVDWLYNNYKAYYYVHNGNSYEKLVADKWYSASKYQHLRIYSNDMRANYTINDIKIITEVKQRSGLYYQSHDTSLQSLWRYELLDPQTIYSTSLSITNKTGSISLLKEGDDVDLYNRNIMINDEIMYATKDNKMVIYDDDKLLSKILVYPSKDEMISNDLFLKNINYEYVDYEFIYDRVIKKDELNIPITKKKLVNKVDSNGNYIVKRDEFNNIVVDEFNNMVYEQEEIDELDENNKPIYEMEDVIKTNDEGIPIVKTLYNEDGSYKMVSCISDVKYPSLKEMDNIKPLENVEFSLYDKDNKVIKAYSNKDGIVRFDNVIVGDYTLKETKTLDDYILDDKVYNVKVELNKISYVNDKKAIINYKNIGRLLVNKKDIDDNDVEDVIFDVYKDNKVIASMQTDINGNALLSLVEGDYYVKERIAPLKYNNDHLEKSFTINNDKTSLINYKNSIKFDDISIFKVNEIDKALSNAKICIESIDNQEFELEIDHNLTKTNKYCYISSNKALEIKLEIGYYVIYEEIAPKGYIKDNKKYEVKVEGHGLKHEVKIVNKAIMLPKTGK